MENINLFAIIIFFFHSLYEIMSRHNVELFGYLKQHLSNTVNNSAYNWIRPSLWSAMFGKSAAAASKISF